MSRLGLCMILVAGTLALGAACTAKIDAANGGDDDAGNQDLPDGGGSGVDGGITPPVSGTCGDEVCSDGELCSTCAGDCGPCATGVVFYVSSSDGNDANDGKSTATPWKSLAKVQSAGGNGTIHAGDSILFKKGDVFVGTLNWDRYYGGSAPTGTANARITFASYGTGAKPVFEYPPIDGNSPGASDRLLLTFYGLDYIVIDGLHFDDPTIAANDKTTLANLGVAINFGSFDEAINNHCTVQNVDMTHVGMGVVMYGEFNTVDHCTMIDMKDLVDTQCANPNDTGPCSYEDYGANGVTISGNDNVVTHNTFAGNWAHSYDFVFNGGAVEAYGGTLGLSRNKVMFNTITDCNGVMEIGSEGGANADDNIVAYNLLVNNGMLTWVNQNGVFATATSNVQYFNNTVVETPSSRFLDDGYEFGASSGGGADILFNFRNNIFVLSSGADILHNGVDMSMYAHSNNVFVLSGGGVTHFTLDATEVSPVSAMFTDTTNADPLLWDYHLLPGSPARGAGMSLGLGYDIEGHAVPDGPDDGAFQSP